MICATGNGSRGGRWRAVRLSASRWWGRRSWVVVAVAAVSVLAWGADRRPADPTRPLPRHGTPEYAVLRGPTVRVATFNIHGGKGEDGVLDLGRTAQYLEGFDIVGLNEVHSARFTRFASQAEVLGRRLGMAAVFVPGERRFWHEHFGNGVLSRVALGAVQRVPLRATVGKGYRSAVLTRFRLAHREVNLMVVHLNHSHGRQSQLQAVTELFLSLAEPAILMGDLNTEAGDPLLAALFVGARDAVAEGDPKLRSVSRKDWIFTRGFRALSADMVVNDASDHPCVQAELELVTPGSRRAGDGIWSRQGERQNAATRLRVGAPGTVLQ